MVKVLKRTIPKVRVGREGLDKKTGTDHWMHADILNDPEGEEKWLAEMKKKRRAKMVKSEDPDLIIQESTVPDFTSTKLDLVLDLNKARLHFEKLVKKPVQVQGAKGKVFTRMQWVDPSTGQPANKKQGSDIPSPESSDAPPSKGNKGKQTLMVTDSQHFKDHVSKKYTKQHLMDQARKQGITWNEHDHAAINWMRAHGAIKRHIDDGNPFEVEHQEKDIDKNMKQKGADELQKHILNLIEKHGSRDAVMDWAKRQGIEWADTDKTGNPIHPQISWMRAATAIKKRLAEGKMVDGQRVRKKELMKEATSIVSDDIKEQIRDMSKEHGKDRVIARAKEYGLAWDEKEHPAMNWMRAAMSIQKFIAQGGKFNMEGDVDTSKEKFTESSVEDVTLTKFQSFAIDATRRVCENRENQVKQWGIHSILADNKDMSEGQARDKYDEFMRKASQAKVMIHFDPDHILSGNTTMVDQIMSDGKLKNPYELGLGDKESREMDERELFSGEYDDAEEHERPVYGCIDFYNKGLDASSYGSVALVLKNSTNNRVTCTHTDSSNLPWETNGKLTRHMDYAHQAIADLWMTKWKTPKGHDKLRQRAFNAVIDGETNNDVALFEAQVHGGVDIKRDIDHVLVPNEWQSSSEHQGNHDKIKQFAKLAGVDVKYE